MIWNFTDIFEEDELKETKPKRNTFTIKDVEEYRKNPKRKSEFKIRSIRDLIDRWYFKSLAKDLTKIQPEPLKMKTKMRCLNYILDAQKSDYEKAVSTDEYESDKD
ncbi:hypothetical protein FWK35_00029930 [Aphis craccivora]|uniref:Uncharacterized protein n=1 Tax=Aphis craccivora TaxID=307492 RepID=A0A6G0YB74_APHCR|nr:hypothetical protein FWK35_00029930 [Aphis craccivora]